MKAVSLLVAAWLVVGATAPAPARTAPALPTLAGVTTLSGTHSGYVRVKVPVRSKLNLHYDLTRSSGPNEAIAISGNGRFIGFALVPEDSGRFPSDARVAGTFNRCRSRGCPPSEPLQYTKGSSDVPAGIYRLYLVADGAPVTVTFRLDGPSGSTKLTPQHPLRIPMASPKPIFAEPAHRGYFSGGATYRLASPSWMASALWVETPGLGGAYSPCMYRGGASPGAAGAFAPQQCAADNYQGDSPDVFPPSLSTDSVEYTLYETDRGVPKGTWSKGYWWASAAPVVSAGMTTVFIPFR